ncbi:MAG: response regulator [Deltaproteobacteria bacterium]|nr:response regulator [Deltaproteobacteria bacterium]
MPIRVLIVDDDVTVRTTLSYAFEAPEFAIELADSGEAGVARFTGATWDVLLIDKNMPGMNGVDVIRAVRERDLAVGVLMMTGLGTVDSAVETLSLGVDDYLEKPFADINEVVEHVRKTAAAVRDRRQGATNAIDHFRRASSHLAAPKGESGAPALRATLLTASAADADFVAAHLKTHGVELDRTATPAALVARLQQTAPDLLVVDVEGLGDDPLPFLTELRRLLPKVACVVIAAQPSLAFVTRLLPLALSCMLVKPLSPTEFDRRVGHTLDRVRRGQRLAGISG